MFHSTMFFSSQQASWDGTHVLNLKLERWCLMQISLTQMQEETMKARFKLQRRESISLKQNTLPTTSILALKNQTTFLELESFSGVYC